MVHGNAVKRAKIAENGFSHRKAGKAAKSHFRNVLRHNDFRAMVDGGPRNIYYHDASVVALMLTRRL